MKEERSVRVIIACLEFSIQESGGGGGTEGESLCSIAEILHDFSLSINRA